MYLRATHKQNKTNSNTATNRDTKSTYTTLSVLFSLSFPLTTNSNPNRGMFRVAEFAAKYALGTPIAGNFYQAQYDDYVPQVYASLDSSRKWAKNSEPTSTHSSTHTQNNSSTETHSHSVSGSSDEAEGGNRSSKWFYNSLVLAPLGNKITARVPPYHRQADVKLFIELHHQWFIQIFWSQRSAIETGNATMIWFYFDFLHIIFC